MNNSPHLHGIFLLSPYFYCYLMCGCVHHSFVSTSLWSCGLWPPRLLCPWDFPGKNTGVGCHFSLQRIFPTQGSNPHLLHCRWILYPLSHRGSPFNDHRFKWAGSIEYLVSGNLGCFQFCVCYKQCPSAQLFLLGKSAGLAHWVRGSAWTSAFPLLWLTV